MTRLQNPLAGPRTFLPSVVPIQHIYYSESTELDSHGNPIASYSDPVDETCICWWPLERRTWSQDIVSTAVVDRDENAVHMLVVDASKFVKNDRVIIQDRLYEVEGVPTDWAAAAPFPTTNYNSLLGGEVNLRRVTSTGVLAEGTSPQ
jgi:hypothetical protein